MKKLSVKGKYCISVRKKHRIDPLCPQMAVFFLKKTQVLTIREKIDEFTLKLRTSCCIKNKLIKLNFKKRTSVH